MQKIFKFDKNVIFLDSDKIESFAVYNVDEYLRLKINYKDGTTNSLCLKGFEEKITERIVILVNKLNDYLFNLFTDEKVKPKNFRIFACSKDVGEDFRYGEHIYDTFFTDKASDTLIGTLRI